MNNFLTVAEVAEYLKVNQKTIRTKIKRGEITAYKIGDGWRITQDDLNSYIERCKIQPMEERKHEEE